MTDNRTRTYGWADPGEPHRVKAEQNLTGLEYVQAVVDQKMSFTPASDTLGYRLSAAGDGYAEAILEKPHEWLFNSNNGVQGGIIAAIIDSAVAMAIITKLPAGKGVTTLDLTTRYIRAISHGSGPVVVKAFAEHVGRTTGTARAEVYDAAGRLCASASTTVLVLEL